MGVRVKEQNVACFPIWFDKIRKAVQKRQVGLLKPYGLGSLHAMYLVMLWHNPKGLTMKELCENLYVDKANTSRAISTLEEKEYVYRDSSGTGVSKYRVLLSKEGKTLANEISKEMKNFHDRLFQTVTAEEQKVVRTVMNKIKATLEEIENYEIDV